MAFSIIVPTTQQVLYASWITGRSYNSTTVTSASDQCAAINAKVSSALANGPVKLVIDCWIAAGVPLLAQSNMTIEGISGSGIYCKNGLNAPAICNPNWTSSCIGGTLNGDGSRSNYTTDYTGSHIVDSNISVVGRLQIVGNRGDGTTGNCTSGDPRVSAGNPLAAVNAGGVSGVPAGLLVTTMMFAGVKNLVLEGLTILDPPTFGIFPSNCFDVDGSDITVLDPITVAGGTPGFSPSRNTAGIQMDGPIARAHFRRVTVSTADDCIALNACDGNLSGSIALDAGPQVFGGWSSVFQGPISDVSYEELTIRNGANVVRFLPGYNAISRVTIRGVKGTTYGECLVAVPFGGAGDGSGSLSQILLDDWQFSVTGAISGGYLCDLGFNSSLFEIRGWKVIHSQAGCYNPGLRVSAAIHDDIRVDIQTDESVAANQRPHLEVTSGATVKHARVRGSRYRASGLTATTTPLVQIDSGATVNDLHLDGLTDDNGGGLLLNNGSLSTLRCSGVGQSNTTSVGITNNGTVAKRTGTGVGVTSGGSGSYTSDNFANV